MSDTSPKQLLRVEGVNLSAVIDDTDNLSVRRGASLMLRQAVRDLATRLPALSPISLGASVGLFAFSADDPQQVVDDCAALLNNDPNYRWLTFVIDYAALADGFEQAHQRVIAANRLRQFQQPTLLPAASSGAACCGLDRLRPAGTRKVKDTLVSDSVFARFEFGRQQRQEFYRQELEQDRELRFTNDLDELSAPGPRQNFGNLNAKMAVIYLDGNHFGAIQRNCDSATRLQEFDQMVQGYRREFLTRLLDVAANDPAFANYRAIRLETLEWGGDEMLLVVPAWQGMAVLQLFFDVSADWEFDQRPLTHAAGLVFCHHKTPIAQAMHAARALTDSVKAGFGDPATGYNAFDYLVLESMSYPVGSLQQHWRDYYGAAVKRQLPPLRPFSAGSAAWSERLPLLRETLAELPRGALYAIASDWLAHWRAADQGVRHDALQQRIARFRKVAGDDCYRLLFDRLFGYFNPRPGEPLERAEEQQHLNPGWLHLVELWDYLAPEAAA